MQPGSFDGTRARFQRLKDAKFFAGWILELAPMHVRVRLNQPAGIESGDEFFFQVFGDKSSALFKGKLGSAINSEAIFSVESEVKVVPSTEEIRLLVQGLKCALKLGWFEATGEIVDVSPSGVGLTLNVPVERGEVAEITLISTSGVIQGKGEIRFCREVDGKSGVYRVGIELEEFDRLNAAKWGKLLESAQQSLFAA